MKRSLLMLLIGLCLLPAALRAQSHIRTDFKDKNYVDTSATMVWAGVNMSGHLPMGYLKEWFKPNLSVGTNLLYKSKSNWTIDLAGSYMFGANIRDTSFAFLGDLVNDNGIVWDGNGMKATL